MYEQVPADWRRGFLCLSALASPAGVAEHGFVGHLIAHTSQTSMTPKNCFGIIIRTTGLLVLLVALYYFFFGLLLFRGAFSSMAPLLLMQSGLGMCVGSYLLRGAPLILRFAYPNSHAIDR
jgi:hypothetical protein